MLAGSTLFKIFAQHLATFDIGRLERALIDALQIFSPEARNIVRKYRIVTIYKQYTNNINI